MNRLYSRAGAFALSSALCLITVGRLSAQTTAAPATTKPAADEETIQLSPFVVEANEDQGYTAKDTLAGTRVRTELKDVASAISVVTAQFLKDTGAKNSQDLLVYTPSTEVGGLRGNFSGQGGASVYQEVLTNPSSTTRVRGLDSADNTRDYFLTDIPWDGFNVGRVDLQRGPNSILFGVGSPAGIINTSLNGAAFKTAYKVENVTSSFGSQRNLMDVNQVLLDNQLAIRFAAVNDQQRYEQEPAFNNTTRYYGALRFDPKLFNWKDSHTSFRANYENGRVNSNNPRTLPPEDMISPFFLTGNDAYGNPNLNKLTVNQYIPGFGNNSALVNSTYNKGGFAQGRTYWPTVLSYFNGSSPSTPGVQPGLSSGLATQVISGEFTLGWAIDQNGNISPPSKPGNAVNIDGRANFRPLAIPDFQQWAANTAIPGGSYYADVTMSDPSIFDFYHKLLDGDNKREWQNWNAYNLAFSQTFFSDRVGLEAVYDSQTYTEGQIGFLQGVNYAIEIDPNVTLADGSFNPNLGRPYVANSAAAGNTQTTTRRDSTRLTAYGDIRAEDYLGKTTLARILGRHVITGLLDLDHKESKDYQWSQYATDLGWESLNNFDQSTKVSNYRQFDWVDYIGGSLLGASTASGANLGNITNIIAPPSNNSVTYFNSHWNKPTTPGAPGYVNPADPFTYLNSNDGTTVTSTQNNNPANYVGWQTAAVKWENANNPSELPDLVTGGKTLKYRDSSKALTWQAYFFDGDLAATYGWRKDDIVNYATAAPVDATTGVTALNYGTDASSRTTVSGQSRTWGGVYHLPKSIMGKLPGGTTLSFFYDKSSNFKADAPRTDLAGGVLPNPDGDTKEYGVTITTLDDKLSLKVGRFNTVVHNATFNIT
ncbi:MAG TPA: TonB-dependent receptor plug domain-containing protein, partial [Lacunisphaera sp.]